jgi:hypothetical protein
MSAVPRIATELVRGNKWSRSAISGHDPSQVRIANATGKIANGPGSPERTSDQVVSGQSEIAENRCCPNWDKLLVKLGQLGSQTDPLDPRPSPAPHAQWLAGVPVSRRAAHFQEEPNVGNDE